MDPALPPVTAKGVQSTINNTTLTLNSYLDHGTPLWSPNIFNALPLSGEKPGFINPGKNPLFTFPYCSPEENLESDRILNLDPLYLDCCTPCGQPDLEVLNSDPATTASPQPPWAKSKYRRWQRVWLYFQFGLFVIYTQTKYFTGIS